MAAWREYGKTKQEAVYSVCVWDTKQ